MPAIKVTLDIQFNTEEEIKIPEKILNESSISLFHLKTMNLNLLQNYGSKIRLLDLSFSKLTGNELSSCLQICRKLNSLILNGCNHLDEVNLKQITILSPKLKKLSLSLTKNLTTNGASEIIKHGSELRVLNLSWQHQLGEKNIYEIATYCLKLKKLYLSNFKNLTHPSLDNLILKCKQIKVLNLDWCAKLKKEELDLRTVPYVSTQGIY